MTEPELGKIRQHLENIVGERNPFTQPEHLETTAQYLLNQFEAMGLEVTRETVEFEGTRSQNILAHTPDTSDDLFVLAAHYDSVPDTPGADDNASAVAALLEIAQVLSHTPLQKSLIFSAFTLEEYGFIGAKHFIERDPERKKRLSAMISLEMLGFKNPQPGSQSYPPYVDINQYPDTGDFIAVVGNEPSAGLAKALAHEMARSVPALKVETLVVPGQGENFSEVRLSDHSPFWDAGIPAVMVTDTAFFRNPNYHKPSDTLETLDLEFIRDNAQAVTAFLKQFLNQTS
ncbi:MAG: M20/M25/M40 family metallo-hydrolase [Nitrospinae bacterium]|nr:M20/M25/M40 family metallo-hydrolase [Nitrospinota bacterium]MBL7021474.1 M20/M25/M40 family metallo-hydrolase [Nitrospinaceae bacterium]